MLDPWIIEEIRRREEDSRRDERMPAVLELPIIEAPTVEGTKPDDSDKSDRGIAIIDFSIG